jgi:pyruvate,water dikinase
VWASLWSDAALLYRQELKLDIEKSSMAVVIQEIVDGDQSGVVFGKNPFDGSEAVIEAVYGLNQGLVDGSVEPDRWIVDRKTGTILSLTPAPRTRVLVPCADGVRFEPLPVLQSEKPPLTDDQVTRIFNLVTTAERLFNAPQDVEWTIKQDCIHALQSRPITARRDDTGEDQRTWYLSLRRSFDNLKALRSKIENELIPAMVEEASRFAVRNLTRFSDAELSGEINERCASHQQWMDRYWNDFIPFAHGMRLFGQIYNDMMRPADPYEFVDLLRNDTMLSIERNRMLWEMASIIKHDGQLASMLHSGNECADPVFEKMLNTFLNKYGDTIQGFNEIEKQKQALVHLLLEMAIRQTAEKPLPVADINKRINDFMAHFPDDQRDYACELLELSRASYRMRDDDNLYLGKIEYQMNQAIDEAKQRLIKRGLSNMNSCAADELCMALNNPDYVPTKKLVRQQKSKIFTIKPRQLVGQPAGPGVGMGTARVIIHPSELFAFKAGEILVCDAVDPAMTFVVPLSSGIVERRGGMLIHGAIIAREYGVACVTGVPDATELIHTGDHLTVDGYLGIVTIAKHV